MAFSNVNDPAGVHALLDQLRSSQAWQEAVAEPPPHPPELEASRSESVASLLSQLSAPPAQVLSTPQPIASNQQLPVQSTTAADPAPPRSGVDITAYSYQHALPVLAQLSEDDHFIKAIKELKTKQNELERQLWEERTALHDKYVEKVTAAKTRANLIGSSITKHEATMLADAYQRERKQFDTERALAAWDALTGQQQDVLRQLGVPALSKSEDPSDLQRQQRVVQVLEVIMTE